MVLEKEFPNDYPYLPKDHTTEGKIPHSSNSFKSKRGDSLWYQEWYSSTDPGYYNSQTEISPACVVIFCHGIQEHSTRYNHVMQRIAAMPGVRVVAMDYTGHGLSESCRSITGGEEKKAYTKARGYFHRLEHVLKDMDMLLEKVVFKDMNPSNVIYWGQSFGGLIAALSQHRNKELFKHKGFNSGLILTSSAMNIDRTLMMKIQAPLGPLFSKICPRLPIVKAVAP